MNRIVTFIKNQFDDYVLKNDPDDVVAATVGIVVVVGLVIVGMCFFPLESIVALSALLISGGIAGGTFVSLEKYRTFINHKKRVLEMEKQTGQRANG